MTGAVYNQAISIVQKQGTLPATIKDNALSIDTLQQLCIRCIGKNIATKTRSCKDPANNSVIREMKRARTNLTWK